MSSEEKAEGIVLRSLDFRDRQKIITLFTPTHGLISLIVKGITKKKSHLLTLTSPFTKAEYHFSIGRSTLYTYKDGTPLETHHHLRQNLASIEAATTFALALLDSQLPGKASPKLYQLLLTYLRHLINFPTPEPLTASFRLKLLKHEGHLSLDHPPPYFTSAEWQALTALTEARKMDTLKETPVSLSLQEKIEKLFRENL